MITFLTIFVQFIKIVEVVVIGLVILLAADLILFAYVAPRTVKENAPRSTKNPAATKNAVAEMMDKERLRREKETEAHKDFFEEEFVRGFDENGRLYARGIKVPTEKALEYYKTMDKLTDTVRMDMTEEILDDLR